MVQKGCVCKLGKGESLSSGGVSEADATGREVQCSGTLACTAEFGCSASWLLDGFPWSSLSGLGPRRRGKTKGGCLSTGELLLSWEQLRMRLSSISSLLCGLSSRWLLQEQLMDQLDELIKLGFDGMVFLHDVHKPSLDIVVL